MSSQGELWRMAGTPARAFQHGESAGPYDLRARLQAGTIKGAYPAREERIRRAGLAPRESDSGLFSWQSLTRAKSCGRAALCLWMDSGCGCADSANHIT